MVATLARLRLRLLRNTLLREKWRIVLLVLGGVYALGLLVLAVAGLGVLGATAGVEVRNLVVVAAGSLLVLGWAVVPVVAFGLDDTLDPQRFAITTAPSPRFALGLLVAGAVSIPGAVTVLVCLATAVAWIGTGSVAQRVGGGLVGLAMGALGAILCLLLARVTTTAASGLVRGRRGRDLAGLLGFGAVLLLAFVPSLLQGVSFDVAALRGVGRALAWTPFGAAWAVPADVAAGDWGQALARLAIVLATLALAGWAYVVLLGRSMTSVGSGGGPAAVRTTRLPFAHALLARAPRITPGAAAVAGRSLRYWRGDPRYLASAGSILLMPLLALLMAFLATTQDAVAPRTAYGIASLFLAPLAAWLGSWSIHDDVAYDSTAFWLHVATGVRGVEDRLGRVLATAVWLVPIALVLAVVPPVLLGRAAEAPAVLGMTLALLGAGFGVSCVTSVLAPYPAPPPGASPLSTKSGGTALAMLAQLGSFVALAILVLPTTLTLLLVALVAPAWGWLTLLVGAVSGLAWTVVGIRRGAVLYDARAVDVLTRIRSWPTH